MAEQRPAARRGDALARAADAGRGGGGAVGDGRARRGESGRGARKQIVETLRWLAAKAAERRRDAAADGADAASAYFSWVVRVHLTAVGASTAARALALIGTVGDLVELTLPAGHALDGPPIMRLMQIARGLARRNATRCVPLLLTQLLRETPTAATADAATAPSAAPEAGPRPWRRSWLAGARAV